MMRSYQAEMQTGIVQRMIFSGLWRQPHVIYKRTQTEVRALACVTTACGLLRLQWWWWWLEVAYRHACACGVFSVHTTT